MGYLFWLKEKIRRIGGCKGRLSRVYLTQISTLSDIGPIRYRTYQISNLSDTEPIRSTLAIQTLKWPPTSPSALPRSSPPHSSPWPPAPPSAPPLAPSPPPSSRWQLTPPCHWQHKKTTSVPSLPPSPGWPPTPPNAPCGEFGNIKGPPQSSLLSASNTPSMQCDDSVWSRPVSPH